MASSVKSDAFAFRIFPQPCLSIVTNPSVDDLLSDSHLERSFSWPEEISLIDQVGLEIDTPRCLTENELFK